MLLVEKMVSMVMRGDSAGALADTLLEWPAAKPGTVKTWIRGGIKHRVQKQTDGSWKIIDKKTPKYHEHMVPAKKVGKRWMHPSGNTPEHLKGIAIPPDWTEVHVSNVPGTAVLAYGRDKKGRRQGIRSAHYTGKQAAAKFARVKEYANKERQIQGQVKQHLLHDDRRIREAASVISLIMHTAIRPGSGRDTKADQQAYGATTLEGRHVKKDAAGNVELHFVGKKGVQLRIPVRDKQLANMLLARRSRAGNTGKLFNTKYDEVVHYMRSLDGGQFTPKDIRTHIGTTTAIREIARLPTPKNKTQYKRAVKEVGAVVSQRLGNTPAIALKSYIAPEVFHPWVKALKGHE